MQRTGATAVAGTASKRSWAFQGGSSPKSAGTGKAATSAQRAADANVVAAGGTKRSNVPTADGPNADASGGAASTASA